MNRQTEAVARHFWRIVSSHYPHWGEVWDILNANTDILVEVLTWPQRPANVPCPEPLRLLLRRLMEQRSLASDAKRVIYMLYVERPSNDPTFRKDGQGASS